MTKHQERFILSTAEAARRGCLPSGGGGLERVGRAPKPLTRAQLEAILANTRRLRELDQLERSGPSLKSAVNPGD